MQHFPSKEQCFIQVGKHIWNEFWHPDSISPGGPKVKNGKPSRDNGDLPQGSRRRRMELWGDSLNASD